MDESTATLVRQLRDALLSVESPVDIGLMRRKAVAAADQWLAHPPAQTQEPVYYVTVSGRLHETEPTLAAFGLSDGRYALYTAPQPGA